MLYSYARGVDKLTFNPLQLPLKRVYSLQALNKLFNALKTFYLSMYTNKLLECVKTQARPV